MRLELELGLEFWLGVVWASLRAEAAPAAAAAAATAAQLSEARTDAESGPAARRQLQAR